MTKADLHVHSKFSSKPSEWLLRQMGSSESYTEPEEIYAAAKSKGMDFVTITDHNSIVGVMQLLEAHPSDVFTGVELTATFPEDGCMVHILVYGFTIRQFTELNRLRANIYKLRDYLLSENLAHSVAHISYKVSSNYSYLHIEKLILLFDVFEGLNASRNQFNNGISQTLLEKTDKGYIDKLYQIHKITPCSETSWKKGFTGGSDDHAGLFIAKGYTTSSAETTNEFLNDIRNRQTFYQGTCNSYRELAIAIYKVAFDFSNKNKKHKNRHSVLSVLSNGLFSNKMSLIDKLLIKWRLSTKFSDRFFSKDILTMIYSFQRTSDDDLDTRLSILYKNLSSITDGFIVETISSLFRNTKQGDIGNLATTVHNALPGITLCLPFLGSLQHMFENRELVLPIKEQCGSIDNKNGNKILWFTDTFDDLNGVSVTIRNALSQAKKRNIDLTAVICQPSQIVKQSPFLSIMNLEPIKEFTPDFYNTVTLRIPSILKSIELIYQHNPDQIIISTPGPVGLIGMLLSHILNIPCTAIYHTDFTSQAEHIIGDSFVNNMLEWYTRWFYRMADSIKVPTGEYIQLLDNRNFPRHRMSLFQRGIDTTFFAPDPILRDATRKKFGIHNGITLLYAGRVSQDKNIDFIATVYRKLLKIREDINLVIAGDGPYLENIRETLKGFSRVIFTGRVLSTDMTAMYNCADMLIFPSTTDTFGMSVLEAQSCGTPVIVSDIGGPQEIVKHNKTGYVVEANSIDEWVNAVKRLIFLIDRKPEGYLEMRFNARFNVEKNYGWDSAIANITNTVKKDRDNVLSNIRKPISDNTLFTNDTVESSII